MASSIDSPRIALVGCGRWGRHILRDLVLLGCDVIVVDPRQSAREHALGCGATAVTDDLAGVNAINGVVIATPAGDHASMIDAALEKQVPIFCEKPLALTAEDAASVAARGDSRLFVMDKWRYHPGVEALRDLARSGELGEVVGLRTTRIGSSPTQVDTDPVWTLAPHDLSIALEILGHLPEPRMAVADFADGRPVGMTAILGERPWFVLEVGGESAVERREIRLTCSAGVALLPDAYSDHLLVMSSQEGPASPSPRQARPISVEAPLLRELRTFVDHLGGGPAPRSSAAEGSLIASTLARLRQMAGIDDTSPTGGRDGHDDD